jgi:hypothetical protein
VLPVKVPTFQPTRPGGISTQPAASSLATLVVPATTSTINQGFGTLWATSEEAANASLARPIVNLSDIMVGTQHQRAGVPN